VQFRFGRFGALCGLFFVLALTFGNQMAAAGESTSNDKASIIASFGRHRTASNHVGMALAFFGFAAFIVFLGYLRDRLQQAGSWLASTAVVAATIMVAVKLVSVLPEYAGQLHQTTGDLAVALHDLADAGFVMSGLPFAIFVTAAAVAGLLAGKLVMPRGVAWAGVVLGVPGMVTPVLGFINPGTYNPAFWLLEFLWIGVLAIIWTLRPSPAPAQDSIALPKQAAMAATGASAGS
jgi:hypothetical protein